MMPARAERHDPRGRHRGHEDAAGNLAPKVMATGGVYVGGGIAPKILSRLQGPAFIQAFTDKGRMRPLLEAMPVRVVLNDRLALLVAAGFAGSEMTEA